MVDTLALGASAPKAWRFKSSPAHQYRTMKENHVIYVPGLGDNLYRWQGLIVQQWWRLFGLHGHLQPMPWGDREKFQPKLQRLLHLIDTLEQEGYAVSLVGAS